MSSFLSQHVLQLRKPKLYQAPIIQLPQNSTLQTTTKTPAETTFIPNEGNSNSNKSSEDHAVNFSGQKIPDLPLPVVENDETTTSTTEKPSTTSKFRDYDDDEEEEKDDDHEADFGGCQREFDDDGFEEGDSDSSSGSQNAQSNTAYIPPPYMGGAGAGSCFSSDTIVKLLNGNEKRMVELELEDWVLSAGDDRIGYNKVISWLHRMPNVTETFLKITLENGKVIKITKKHFIYKIDCSGLSLFL
uniref:Hint domain-containing protein n=1 Tax=Panagrolaimus davidi TaxID=227884 RepID=A0A914PS63_9BILA